MKTPLVVTALSWRLRRTRKKRYIPKNPRPLLASPIYKLQQLLCRLNNQSLFVYELLQILHAKNYRRLKKYRKKPRPKQTTNQPCTEPRSLNPTGYLSDYLAAGGAGADDGGSRVWVCPMALYTCPCSSCRQMTVSLTHGSSNTSAMVALFFGSISSMRLIISLLSRGSSRNSRHGPLMTSGFFSPSVVPLAIRRSVLVEAVELSGIIALSGVPRSVVDLDGTPFENLVNSVPGVGVEAKSL